MTKIYIERNQWMYHVCTNHILNLTKTICFKSTLINPQINVNVKLLLITLNYKIDLLIEILANLAVYSIYIIFHDQSYLILNSDSYIVSTNIVSNCPQCFLSWALITSISYPSFLYRSFSGFTFLTYVLYSIFVSFSQ